MLKLKTLGATQEFFLCLYDTHGSVGARKIIAHFHPKVKRKIVKKMHKIKVSRNAYLCIMTMKNLRFFEN